MSDIPRSTRDLWFIDRASCQMLLSWQKESQARNALLVLAHAMLKNITFSIFSPTLSYMVVPSTSDLDISSQ